MTWGDLCKAHCKMYLVRHIISISSLAGTSFATLHLTVTVADYCY